MVASSSKKKTRRLSRGQIYRPWNARVLQNKIVARGFESSSLITRVFFETSANNQKRICCSATNQRTRVPIIIENVSRGDFLRGAHELLAKGSTSWCTAVWSCVMEKTLF